MKKKLIRLLSLATLFQPANHAQNDSQEPVPQRTYTLPMPSLSTVMLAIGAFAGWRFYKRLVRIEDITRKIDETTQTHLKEFRLFRDTTTETLGHINATASKIDSQVTQIQGDLKELSGKQAQEFLFQHESTQQIQTTLDNLDKTVTGQHTDLKKFIQAAIDTRKPVTFLEKTQKALDAFKS
jgi:methyl-accepting chemotaxis protein